MPDPRRQAAPGGSGLVQGGRGGPEDELLIDGQEEVFARTEVELGRVEHKVEAGSAPGGSGPAARADDDGTPGASSH